MAPDDTDIDGGAGEPDRTDQERRVPAEGVSGPKWGLPNQLSETVTDRRAYGLERMTTGASGGLLSPRERQYVRHADRLDPPERTAVEDVLVERVDEFVDDDWPVIQEQYPEVATALRESICGAESD